MRTIVTPEAMRLMDAAAIAQGTPGIELMERAAQALVDCLSDMLGGLQGRLVACYCGKGNNGGDGYAAARLVTQAGGKAVIRELGLPTTPDAITNRERAVNAGVEFVTHHPGNADAALDALLGTGLSRAPEGQTAALIEEMMRIGAPILAADVPSGLDAHTGKCYRPCVTANRTITFQFAKAGQHLTTCPQVLGAWTVVDIGIPAGDVPRITSLDPQDLPALLPPRAPTAHKGDHGRVLARVGSVGMAGAAALAASGALRAGAGLVTVACEHSVIPILQTLVPVAQCRSLEQALAQPTRHDVLLAGCGMGQGEEQWEQVMRLYAPDVLAVLDADALNMLAMHPMKLGARTVITPHVGEAARLLGVGAQDVVHDMLGAAHALQTTFGCTVVLKGHASVIQSDGRTDLNTVGSPVLAKGGSGDVLAGIIAGLLAQGLQPHDAARVGCLWLGRAAQIAEQQLGSYAPLATDILQYMGQATLK